MFPIITEFGPFSIQTLWIFLPIAFVVTLVMFLKNVQLKRINPAPLVDHGFLIFLSVLFFSRVAYFFMNLPRYTFDFQLGDLTKILYVWDRGLSFWGAILGLVLAVAWISKKHKESPFIWYDALLIPTFVGMIIGHFGQFLDGQGYGIPSNLPWAFIFVNPDVRFTVPVHPTQIYAMIYITAILLIINKLRKKHKGFFEKRGNLTLLGVAMYSGIRFLFEFLRGDDTIFIGPFRLAHFILLLIFILTFIRLRKRHKEYKQTKNHNVKTIPTELSI